MRGGTPQTSRKTLGTLQSPKVSFLMLLGVPRSHFGHLWMSLGRPRGPIGHASWTQMALKRRKVDTVISKLVLVAFKHQKDLPQRAKCHENIVNTMVLGGANYRKFPKKSATGSYQKCALDVILVSCGASWATFGDSVRQFCRGLQHMGICL